MIEIIPMRLPEMETPRLDDWSAGPSWRDPRLNDMPLPNRLLPPEHFASGSRKGRAEFERRQLIATGRVSSLHGVHQKVVPPQNSLFASRQPGYQAAVAKREAMREEADGLSQLFDAQVSERTFLAAFAVLKVAKVEEQACAAIEGIEAVCRVPPNLRLIDAAAALQSLSKLRLPFQKMVHPPRRYLRMRAALTSQLEAEIARRQSAPPPRALEPRTELAEMLHDLSHAKAVAKLRRRLGQDEARRRIGLDSAAVRFKGRRPEPSGGRPGPGLLPQLRAGADGSPRKVNLVPSPPSASLPRQAMQPGRVDSPELQRSSLTAKNLSSRTKPLGEASGSPLRVAFQMQG